MKIVLATRKSPLALVQAEAMAARLRERMPGAQVELFRVVTTGDRQAEWSLAKQGGKGLFTAELEQALDDLSRQDEALECSRAEVARLRDRVAILDGELQGIHRSRLWKLATRYWRLLEAIGRLPGPRS